MKLWSKSFQEGAPIPPEFAFCKFDPANHASFSDNRNPELAWSDVPAGTRSLALICRDGDVPSIGDDVNQEGRSVRANLPRVDFFHWVLVDLPPSMTELAAGRFSQGVTAHGKPGPQVNGEPALRHGINDYTGWFQAEPAMAGDYYGYDGPCPPWNDELLHRYEFTLYALDVERAPLEGRFSGAQVLAAIQPHILGQASLSGTYTLNPALAKP